MTSITRREIIILIACLALMVGIWYHFKPVSQPVGEYHPALIAPEVKLIPKITIHPKALQVYAPIATAHLKLPESMRNQSVIAATEVISDLHPHEVVSLVDPLTGEVTNLDRKMPYKFLAAESVKEVRLSYGWRGTEKMARLSGSWDVLAVKGWHLGATGSLDGDAQHYIGASVAYRW